MFDFPSSPTQGQEFTPIPNGLTYVYRNTQWVVKDQDAPQDGKTYGRKNSSWQEVLATSYPDAPADGKTYARKDNTWVTVVGCVISDTALVNPQQGQLWWNASNGNLYIWYDDGSGQQWVQVNSVGQ